jgi:hypothetical protein
MLRSSQQTMTSSRNPGLIIFLQGSGGNHVQVTDRRAAGAAGTIQ